MSRRKRWGPPGAGAKPPTETPDVIDLYSDDEKAGAPLPPAVDLTPAGPPVEIIELYPNPLPPPPPPFDRAAALADLQAAFALLSDEELQVARRRMLGVPLVDIAATLLLLDEDVEKLWKKARGKLGNALFGRASPISGCGVQQFRIPTAADKFDYLLRLYFGDDPDRLACCINRAYRDMNRTLHGVARLPEGEGLRDQAADVVRSFLTGLTEPRAAGLDQTAFDDRHRAACEKLCKTYAARFPHFREGQAQKWLNMALKYVFTFGENRLPGYAGLFGLAHIPLDNIILVRLRKYGPPRLRRAWSRIDYEEYMGIQRWVRSAFPGCAPLAVEFALWQNADDEGSRDEDAAERGER